MSNKKIKPKLIVGLGNPGSEYENTYHNVGRSLLAYLVGEEADFRTEPGGRFKYHRTTGAIWIYLTNYMNVSGEGVAAALKYFKATSEDLWVLHDDSDLALGTYRWSGKSGAAGHHGIESIQTSLGTKEFCRLRIGIRHNQDKAGSFVLKRISEEDRLGLQVVFGEIKKEMEKENVF